MAITIPALLDAQIGLIQAELRPIVDGSTNTSSLPLPPYGRAGRISDVLRLLTGLIDSGTLTATGGSATSVQDTGAFTGADTLIGCKVTFTGNITAALANIEANVVTNTTDALNFAPGALPASPAAGDTYTVEFTLIDDQLAQLDKGKGLGASASDVYGFGPAMVQAFMLLIEQLNGTMPSYLTITTANPFDMGSPHMGGGTFGHAGGILLADALQVARDTVEAYTAPA